MFCLFDWNELEVYINKFRIDFYLRNVRQKMNLFNCVMLDLYNLINQVVCLIIIIIYVYFFGFFLKCDIFYLKD